MVKGIVRDNWWLFLILVLCLAGAVGFGVRSKPLDSASSVADADAPYVPGMSARASNEARAEREETALRETMAQYEETYEADPEHKDAPAYLFAIGNLHLQRFQDYGEAARYFELVVTEHPDWEGAYKVYPQLISCYEHTEDLRGLRWVCSLMLERFPDDSQEYLFARQMLESL